MLRALTRIATFAATILMVAAISRGASQSQTQAAGPPNGDYRQAMRDFVQGISQYAKAIRPGFYIIPQNGPEIMTTNGDAAGPVAWDYIGAIDGVGREDLFYGYTRDNAPTPRADLQYMLGFTDLARRLGLAVLVTDYCSKKTRMDDSYRQNSTRGYVSFAADRRDLNRIPAYPRAPYNANKADIQTLSDAKNFLYLIDPGRFRNKAAFLDAVRKTNYDVVLVDLFYDDALTAADVASLKRKANGGARLALCYMSIGEAEDYRYYWQAAWSRNPPSWLTEENPDWAGCYKVRYWEKGWQDIVYGNDSSYLKRILDAGFDGAYLDIIDAYEYFEGEAP